MVCSDCHDPHGQMERQPEGRVGQSAVLQVPCGQAGAVRLRAPAGHGELRLLPRAARHRGQQPAAAAADVPVPAVPHRPSRRQPRWRRSNQHRRGNRHREWRYRRRPAAAGRILHRLHHVSLPDPRERPAFAAFPRHVPLTAKTCAASAQGPRFDRGIHDDKDVMLIHGGGVHADTLPATPSRRATGGRGSEATVTDQATTQPPAAAAPAAAAPAAAAPAAPVETPPVPEVAESVEEFVGQYPDEQYLMHQRRAVPALAGHPLRLVGPEHLRLAVRSRRVAGAEGVVAVL